MYRDLDAIFEANATETEKLQLVELEKYKDRWADGTLKHSSRHEAYKARAWALKNRVAQRVEQTNRS